MTKTKVLTSRDGKCPNCKSDDVVCVGKISLPRPGSSTKLPEPKIKVWLCNNCKKEFFYQGE